MLLCVCLGACGQARVAAPPPGPRASEPTDAIPGDLDLVVRLDLSKMRRALPPGGLDWLSQRAGAASAEGPGSENRSREVLEQALERADTVWIALRPGLELAESDNVVVLRGAFAGFDPRSSEATPRFRGPADLGAGWRLYQRSPPASRAKPVHIYARHEDWLVFASNAEVDSTERTIQLGAGGGRLVPPAQGAISVAARARWVSSSVRDHWPLVADRFVGAIWISGYADLDSTGLVAEIEIRFGTERQAQAAAGSARDLVAQFGHHDGLIGRMVSELRFECVAESLVLRLSLGEQALASMVRCVTKKNCEPLPSTPRSNPPPDPPRTPDPPKTPDPPGTGPSRTPRSQSSEPNRTE